jgi:hypothetical protein
MYGEMYFIPTYPTSGHLRTGGERHFRYREATGPWGTRHCSSGPRKGSFRVESSPLGRWGAAITKTGLNKDWSPTRGAFRQFLNWLDEGVDSDGERYLEMRRRLVAYFDRKNCLTPDELADETLNRVARRLEEEGTITALPPRAIATLLPSSSFSNISARPNVLKRSLLRHRLRA